MLMMMRQRKSSGDYSQGNDGTTMVIKEKMGKQDKSFFFAPLGTPLFLCCLGLLAGLMLSFAVSAGEISHVGDIEVVKPKSLREEQKANVPSIKPESQSSTTGQNDGRRRLWSGLHNVCTPDSDEAASDDEPISSDFDTADHSQLWSDHFDCDPLYEEARPIPDRAAWMAIRGIYHGIFHSSNSSALCPLLHDSGFQVPFEIKVAPGKGRGVFATQKISKGAVVFTTEVGGHMHFHSANDYRRFLRALPRLWACEVMQCSAVEGNGTPENPKSNPVITADMDYSCFVNTHNTAEELNVGCPPEQKIDPKIDCINHDYALRDIEEGEELLTSYGAYVMSWKHFSM